MFWLCSIILFIIIMIFNIYVPFTHRASFDTLSTLNTITGVADGAYVCFSRAGCAHRHCYNLYSIIVVSKHWQHFFGLKHHPGFYSCRFSFGSFGSSLKLLQKLLQQKTLQLIFSFCLVPNKTVPSSSSDILLYLHTLRQTNTRASSALSECVSSSSEHCLTTCVTLTASSP